jgi:hypothetical protein
VSCLNPGHRLQNENSPGGRYDRIGHCFRYIYEIKKGTAALQLFPSSVFQPLQYYKNVSKYLKFDIIIIC